MSLPSEAHEQHVHDCLATRISMLTLALSMHGACGCWSQVSRMFASWYLKLLSRPRRHDCLGTGNRHAALAASAAGEVQAVWVGHASLLVQMHGVTFLTDPVLSERCSFSQARETHHLSGLPQAIIARSDGGCVSNKHDLDFPAYERCLRSRSLR